jgi:hypothetical protein
LYSTDKTVVVVERQNAHGVQSAYGWLMEIQGDNRNITLAHGVLGGSSEAPLSGDQTIRRLWRIDGLKDQTEKIIGVDFWL